MRFNGLIIAFRFGIARVSDIMSPFSDTREMKIGMTM
jgi:hypothetical protein